MILLYIWFYGNFIIIIIYYEHNSQTKIMVNAGTYSTMDNVKTIWYLEEIEGIDCYLFVNPYYNKPKKEFLEGVNNYNFI